MASKKASCPRGATSQPLPRSSAVCARLAAPRSRVVHQYSAQKHQSSRRRRPCWAAGGGGRRRGGLPSPAAASGSSSGGGGSERQEESAESAFATVQEVMKLFTAPRQSSADLDTVVAYLPEAVIDRLIERKRARLEEQRAAGIDPQPAASLFGSAVPPAAAAASAPGQEHAGEELSFEELVSLAQPADLALDAYAARGLLNTTPRSATALSSLKLAPDRFLQRYEVVAQSGEEMALTFDMELEECLQPKYRGLAVVRRWFLKGITGEPTCPGDLPARPEPCWGPEAVALAQLDALQRGDAAGVFRFASPANQQATGPVERFAQMLQSPQYRPLLGHQAAELLRSVQMHPDVTLLIVGVRSDLPTLEPGVTQRVVYSWSLRLQPESQGPEVANCWLTESVSPISQSGLFGGSGGGRA